MMKISAIRVYQVDLPLVEGRMVASDGPGLGVELNMDVLGGAVAEYTASVR